jgi:hypothetical protein
MRRDVHLMVAVVLGAAGRPAGLAEVEMARMDALSRGDVDAVERAELGILTSLLGAQFGPARADLGSGSVEVDVDGKRVIVRSGGGHGNGGGKVEVEVVCGDGEEEGCVLLKERVEKMMMRALDCLLFLNPDKTSEDVSDKTM